MTTMADRKSAQRPPVHVCRMEFNTRLPLGLGAIHTAELPTPLDLNWQPESAALSGRISRACAAFARSGDPNHAGLPTWRPDAPRRQDHMIFDLTARSGPNPPPPPRRALYEALASAPQWNPL